MAFCIHTLLKVVLAITFWSPAGIAQAVCSASSVQHDGSHRKCHGHNKGHGHRKGAGKSLSAAAEAGIAIGSGVTVALVFAALVLFLQRRRDRQTKSLDAALSSNKRRRWVWCCCMQTPRSQAPPAPSTVTFADSMSALQNRSDAESPPMYPAARPHLSRLYSEKEGSYPLYSKLDRPPLSRMYSEAEAEALAFYPRPSANFTTFPSNSLSPWTKQNYRKSLSNKFDPVELRDENTPRFKSPGVVLELGKGNQGAELRDRDTRDDVKTDIGVAVTVQQMNVENGGKRHGITTAPSLWRYSSKS